MKSLIVISKIRPLKDKSYYHIFWFNGKQLRCSLKGRPFKIVNGMKWLSSRGFQLEFFSTN